MTLKETYLQLAERYSQKTTLALQRWQDIEQAYSSAGRHYHTLLHLENMLGMLQQHQTSITYWDTVLFSLYYHDIVYHPLRKDNEEQSAVVAAKQMKLLQVPATIIDQCYLQTLATKTHMLQPDDDTNLFTDADLSILGQTWPLYEQYTTQVRQEYAIVPDMLYKPGRRKVLAHFLGMERIFKTDAFFNQLEQQARLNIKSEMERY